jgi:hypothetical protein
VAVSMLKVRETLVLFFAHLPGLCDWTASC